MGIFRLFGSWYDQVYTYYGWYGIGVGGVCAVVVVIGILTWFDRRR